MGIIREKLKNLLKACGYEVRRVENTEFFRLESLLYRQLARVKIFDFIQIGACDGIHADPIHCFVSRNCDRVRGLVVEPLSDLFQKLRHTYRQCPTITPVNCAVHNYSKTMTLHRVDPQKLSEAPPWAIGISSFEENHHLRSGVPSSLMVSTTVSCRKLSDLINDYGFRKIDLLQIDTEGSDADIILGHDFSWISPRIIQFEYGGPSQTMPAAKLRSVVTRLREFGYDIVFLDCDVVAWQRSIVSSLDSPSQPPEAG